jgi:hypothetical protein
MARPDPTHAKPCTWPRGWQQTWRPRGVQTATSAISRIGTRCRRQFEGSTSSVRSRSPDGKVGRSFRCRCSRVRCRAVVWCDRSVERGATKVRHPSSQGWTAVSLSDYGSVAPATSERSSPLINSCSINIYMYASIRWSSTGQPQRQQP